MFPVLTQVNAAEASLPQSEPLIAELIAEEKRLVRESVFREPLFTWIVGRKRSSP